LDELDEVLDQYTLVGENMDLRGLEEKIYETTTSSERDHLMSQYRNLLKSDSRLNLYRNFEAEKEEISS
jgi:hypothetical protein